jgi:hypothetical protein
VWVWHRQELEEIEVSGTVNVDHFEGRLKTAVHVVADVVGDVGRDRRSELLDVDCACNKSMPRASAADPCNTTSDLKEESMAR